jgi:small-conductance mechanosensitive channel
MKGAIASRIAPLDAVETVAARAEREFFDTVAALADLPAELWRIWPDGFDALLALAGPAIIVAAAILVTFAAVRRLLRRQRRKLDAERSAFVGLVKLAGLDLLALAAAILVGRVLLVRMLGVAHGVESFSSDLTAAAVRWLLGMTLLIMLFQPAAPRFRLVTIDDAGARKAVWRVAILLAIGVLHVALLGAATRGGLPIVSARLISCSTGLGMAVCMARLVVMLRHHGLTRAHCLTAIWLALATGLLWLWGWIALNFELYRGALATTAVLLAALVLDRAVALGIRDSCKTKVTRMLSVLRVVVAALAAAVILRIVVDIWMVGAFGWLSPEQWRSFSRRLTVASAIMVFAAALAAMVHTATEVWLTPEAGAASWDKEAHQAQRSSALRIVRLSSFALIGVIFSLLALSALGLDVTALMVGAGIAGLAIGFGLQTLVKDVVAGLFLVIDDAFRPGETIEFGGSHCQLERINLRGLRLRDQDGRLHTIPFGELGIVINHSRRLVRMTALITLKTIPDKSELVRFSREAAAALRREPMITHAIIGSIGVRLNEAPDTLPGTLALSFRISALAADRTRLLVQRLFEETVDVAGIEALLPAVHVTVSDMSTPSQPDTAGELAL